MSSKVLIRSQKYIEPASAARKQVPILQAGPAHFRYGADLVSGNLRLEFLRQGLVKQDAHPALDPRERVQAPRRLARASPTETISGNRRASLRLQDSRRGSSREPECRQRRALHPGCQDRCELRVASYDGPFNDHAIGNRTGKGAPAAAPRTRTLRVRSLQLTQTARLPLQE